jgi:hypothetical protein
VLVNLWHYIFKHARYKQYCPIPSLSTTDPTWNGLGSNSTDRLPTSSFSHGTAWNRLHRDKFISLRLVVTNAKDRNVLHWHLFFKWIRDSMSRLIERKYSSWIIKTPQRMNTYFQLLYLILRPLISTSEGCCNILRILWIPLNYQRERANGILIFLWIIFSSHFLVIKLSL